MKFSLVALGALGAEPVGRSHSSFLAVPSHELRGAANTAVPAAASHYIIVLARWTRNDESLGAAAFTARQTRFFNLVHDSVELRTRRAPLRGAVREGASPLVAPPRAVAVPLMLMRVAASHV